MRGRKIKFSESAEDILEVLYILQVEEGEKTIHLKRIKVKDISAGIKELTEAGYIIVESDRVNLLERGMEYARMTVRRHRLAERLMADVFQLKEESVNKTSCQFEHLIQEDVEESICTLLGHPKMCPHNKPIPPGRCCVIAKKTVEPVVRPLTELKSGQSGTIAYLLTKEDKKIQKLISMGILPGMKIILLHRVPSYVFQVGHTQVAVDKEIADNIYVKVKI